MRNAAILIMLIEKWHKDMDSLIDDIHKVDGNEMLNSEVEYLKKWNHIDNEMRTVIDERFKD